MIGHRVAITGFGRARCGLDFSKPSLPGIADFVYLIQCAHHFNGARRRSWLVDDSVDTPCIVQRPVQRIAQQIVGRLRVRIRR